MLYVRRMTNNRTPSVDELLLEATNETPGEPMAPYTFRNDVETRAAAEKICARHGVSLPAFLRAAQRLLVRTYGG